MVALAAQLEKRIYQAYWQDGLLDLLAGVALVLTGVGWLAGFIPAGGIAPVLALVLWPGLRRRITEPRMGYVRFNGTRLRELRHGGLALLVLGLGFLAFILLTAAQGGPPSDLERWLAPAIPAFLVALLAISVAAALHLVRVTGYAAAFVLAGIAVAILNAEPGWALLAGGGLMFVAGALLLRRFLHAYPRLDQTPAE